MTIRVIVVDDTILVRIAVANALSSCDDIEVVSTASSGEVALRRIAEHTPDLVTLDLQMPGMDGVATLAEIRKSWPDLPVIMCTSGSARDVAEALKRRGLTVSACAITTPDALSRADIERQTMAELLPLVRRWGIGERRNRTAPSGAAPADRPAAVKATAQAVAAVAAIPEPRAARPRGALAGVRLVAIGVSTGGPDALTQLLPALRGDLPVPVAIVQHMPPLFTETLARRLANISELLVTEAVHGEELLSGHVYLAPGGSHLEVIAKGTGLTAVLTHGPPENSCKPAVDVLFRTAATATKGSLLGVVLTGMGHDGLIGSQAIVDSGGTVIVQDEATSIVWGMPGDVAKAGLASAVMPLEELSGAIDARARGLRTGRSS